MAVTVAPWGMTYGLQRRGVEQMAKPLAGDTQEVTAKLAYQLWEQRGRPFGSPEMDWLAAEKALVSSQRDPKLDFSLYGMTLEANEGPFVPVDHQIKSGST